MASDKFSDIRTKITTYTSPSGSLLDLETAMQRYEDAINIANMPDYLREDAVREPIYSWKNPIGLVIEEKSH